MGAPSGTPAAPVGLVGVSLPEVVGEDKGDVGVIKELHQPLAQEAGGRGGGREGGGRERSSCSARHRPCRDTRSPIGGPEGGKGGIVTQGDLRDSG